MHKSKTNIALLILIGLIPIFFIESVSTQPNNLLLDNSNDVFVENFTPINFEIEIFGHQIRPLDFNSIVKDSGIFKLNQVKQGLVDVLINTTSDEFNFPLLEVQNEIYYDIHLDQIQRYVVEDPLQGFFSEIRIAYNLIWINIAFDDGLFQYNFDGIKEENEFRLFSLDKPIIYLKDIDFSEVNFPQPEEAIRDLEYFQTNSLFIDNQKYLEEHQYSIKGPLVSYTSYGLIHENWIADDDWVGLADFSGFPSYWRTHTSIDIGVRRDHGTEAQVKSDLQYYNKDYIQEPLSGYVRNILIYQMVTHGGESYGDDSWYLFRYVQHQFLWIIWWEWEHSGTITPSEIDNLWYHNDYPDSYIDVNPDGTLILALVCHGFYENAASMANAWVDNEAEAFIGATISIPVVGSDDYSMEFWKELCDNSGTVETATIELCEYYNSIYSDTWNLGDEWEILGNLDATEP